MVESAAAMVRHPPKSQIILDWFTVSYRSVLLALVVVAALGVWGVYACRVGPKRDASAAIGRAEARLAQASALQGPDPLEEVRASARAALDEGHRSFADARYDDARVAAIRSENLSQKAIDLVRGDDASSHSVRFYRVEGDVRVKRSGSFAWEPADRNMALRVGDQVKTSSSASAQLIYFDGTITTVQPGSLLEIRELSEDPATQVRKVSEKLNWGELMASTQRRNVEGSFHEVATDRAAARSEEAGEFRVRYDKEDETASFDVFQGRVEVATDVGRESVGTGERMRMRQGSVLGRELLPGVPRLIAPTDQRVFVVGQPSRESTTLSWEKVPGAARYHLLISGRLLFSDPLYDDLRTETAVVIEEMQPGTYFWKVASVAPSGAEGPFSEVRTFRVSSQHVRDAGDRTPPRIEMAEPVQTGPMLILNGRTEPGALLWVNGEKVDVYDDGSFYSVLKLPKEGINEVVVEAQDAAGNRTRIPKKFLVETY